MIPVKTKLFLFLISSMMISGIYAQTNLNNYKYVIVPKKYDFLEEADKFQLNSLTQFLLKKEGFVALFDDQSFPRELSENRCLGLLANVISRGTVFKTFLTLELKDCNNNIIYTTKEGASRAKDYKKAYHEALRDAFQSFKDLNYSYKPKLDLEVGDSNVEYALEMAKESQQKEEKANPKQEIFPEQEIVESEHPEIPEEVEEIRKGFMSQKPLVHITDQEFLAKPIDFGYRVMDSNKNEVMIFLMTGSSDVFMVKDKNAVVFKNKNGSWSYSENDGSNFFVSGITIKFQ